MDLSWNNVIVSFFHAEIFNFPLTVTCRLVQYQYTWSIKYLDTEAKTFVLNQLKSVCFLLLNIHSRVKTITIQIA